MVEGLDYSAVLFPQMQPADQWRQTLGFDALEAQHGLPQGLLTSVVHHESNGDPDAENPSSGAAGLFQFMPNTARAYQIDPYNPQQAAPAAAQELGTLYRKYGQDLPKTLAAWNWGQGRVDKRGLEKAPAETKSFLQNVMSGLSPTSAEAATQPQGRDFSSVLFPQEPASAPVAPAPPVPAAAGLPVDTQVMPNPDPTQPATMAYPGSSPAMTPPSGVLQPPIDIEKPSPETPPAQAPAAQTALTPDLGDAEILRRIGVDPDLVMKSRFYQPGRFAKEIPQPGSSREGIDTSWVGGFGRGVQRVGEGPAQWVMHKAGQLGLLAPEDVALNDALVKLHEVVYQQQEHPTWTPPLVGKVTGPIDIPATVGQTMALPNVTPLPLKEAGGFLSNVARGVVNSAATGAVAGATQPVYEPGLPGTPGVPGTPDDDYWRQKWQQTKQGTEIGAATGAITSTASAAGNKVVNAARNLSPRYAQVQRALDAATDPSGAVNENIFTAALRTETGGKVSGVEKWQADGMQKWMQHIQTVNKVSAGVGKAMETGAIILPHWLTVAGFSMKKVVDVLYNTPAGRNFLIAASDLQPGSGAMSRLWDTMAAQLPRLAAVHTTQDTIEGQQP